MSAPSSIWVTAVTSGKGGVGKTNVSVNLAVTQAQKGLSVVLFDADLSLANVDITLGLKPKFDVRHVISGERTLEEVLIQGPEGIRIVPASSGVSGLADLSPQEQAGLVRAFSELSFPVDSLIVDTGAGIDPSVLSFCAACQEVIVVICDEPTSITDSYALIKVLSKERGVNRFHLLANMVENDAQGKILYEKVSRVTERFLNIHLGYLGAVPQDPYLKKAVQQQTPVTLAYPRSISSRAFGKITQEMERTFNSRQSNNGLGFFVERIINLSSEDLEC